MDSIEQEAIYICAKLTRQGYVKKEEFRNLELNERLLQQVHYRLAQVGMKLIINTYSPYYAIRLQPEIQENLEESNSLGLKSNEIAMLVILWCKLVLPKRLALESRDSVEAKNRQKNIQQEQNLVEVNPTKTEPSTPVNNVSNQSSSNAQTNNDEPKVPLAISSANGGTKNEPTNSEGNGQKPSISNVSENPANALTASRDDEPEITKYYIKMNELWAEFGERFGNKSIFKATLTRLNNLQFIRVRDEIISEGILLDLLIDSHQMANEVKRSALAYKLAGLENAEEGLDDSDDLEDLDEIPESKK